MRAVRSDWESSIASYIRDKYPALRIETNNRDIVPSRKTRGSFLEIDIFIPELRLGIEANGETYHDRQAYRDDEAYGTEHSDEMYKENYCRKVGIRLIHVWGSESMDSIRSQVDSAIQRRRADPAIDEWHPSSGAGGGSTTEWLDFARSLPPVLWFCVYLAITVAIGVNSCVAENRQAELRATQARENAAAAEVRAHEQEEELRQEKQLRDYQSHYDWWLDEYNSNVDYYNAGAPRRALKPFVDKLAEEIAAYPLSDVPDSSKSEHRRLLSIVRKFSAQLK
ncbi:MAG TPA: hypothetical protein VIL17_04210 [Coriobacteriia bacterium]